MRVSCPKCQQACIVSDAKLGTEKPVLFKCPACQALFKIKPKAQINVQIVPPGMAAAAAPSGERAGQQPAGSGPELLRHRIMAGIRDLPPMPQVMLRAREILANPHAGFDNLAKVLETDQAIAAKVLRYANSAYYGVSATINSVQHAAVVLGHRTLAEVLSLAGAAGLLDTPLLGYGLEAGSLWAHSLATAAGAKGIAQAKAPDQADDAFTAGLIHDIGKLVLEKHVLAQKMAFSRLLERSKDMWLDAETKILGLDHAQVGADICQFWQIPEALCTAIRHHHGPTSANAGALADFVHMADAMAMKNGMATGIDGSRYKLDEGVATRLDLKQEETRRIVAQFTEFVIKTTQQL